MKKLTVLLSLLGLCLGTSQIAGAAKEYDFELIIFEDRSGRYSSSEKWQHELTDSGAAKAPAANASNNPAESKIREIKGIGLAKYAKKLRSNKRYNVLVHKAWRQPGLSHNDAIAIPVDSGPPSTGTATAAKTQDSNRIHGTIKIVLARYLHIYTDLTYQQPLTNPTPVWDGTDAQLYEEFPVNFHRRMRSKELHYIDHPLVGILVMAMPVKPKEES